ncbi:oxidoreductase [Pseudoxanthomonas kalamensis DSM 18571]|uniref:oxidoreductase n=1 Tax=Pseudoxanthomonas kalamensis TaxID=289483 RepID=UPI001391AD66|nr:oxidoreductase [Pseudoxanthomonas kalamensis]KAF1711075.1 oxidoreductase [Pseudoxanthomonas kalamensis DSM 18571]
MPELEQQWADRIIAAAKGVAHESDMVHPTAPGFNVKGTSTLYREDGSVAAQWVKTTADAEARHAAMVAAIDAMAADLPRVKPRKAKGVFRDDLLTVYPIGDPHFGMLSWPDETGEDWNLDIARQVHCDAMSALVAAAPASETGLVINLGDALHFDSMEAKTPRSGHMLDADGRYARVVDVAVTTMRQCIESALEKHKHVHVICVPGNHDETGGLWLARVLSVAYEREPRVTVDSSPAVFAYYKFGRVLLGVHHGHTCKPDKLPGVMAADRAKDWGESDHRHWLMGHVHHESRREFAGVTVESFGTLAARDAYATNGGWRSARPMQAIVYHAKHGEVGRSRVNAEMFAEAA